MGAAMLVKAEFDTGEVRLNYAEGPAAGPALVLLHGGSARWQYFDAIIPDLAARWHVFAPDLRGHGRSGRVAGRYAIRDYARDIGVFLQKVSGPASLFGHSLGGMVALMTASQCPDWVRAVITGDSPLDAASWKTRQNDRDRARIRYWQTLAGGSHTVEEIIAALRRREAFADDDGAYAHLAARLYQNDPTMIGMLLDDFDKALEGYDLEALLPSVRCPVLLLQANPAANPRFGSATTDDEIARALACLPRRRHVYFPGLSHLLFVEDKAAVLQAIEAFMREVEAGLI